MKQSKIQGLRFEILEDRRLLAVQPFPTPLEPMEPRGSLIYRADQDGTLDVAGEVATFTIDVDADQTLTVAVDPQNALSPSVEIVDPLGTSLGVDSANPGLDAVLQTIPTTTPGTYNVRVRGLNDSVGDFHVVLLLNAAVEPEHHNRPGNNFRSAAQSLEAGFIVAGVGSSQRAAVVGGAFTFDDWFQFALADGESTSIALQTAGGTSAIELYDGGGWLLAQSISGDTIDQVISNYVASGGAGVDDIFVRVPAGAGPYTLTVTRGADFDNEENDTYLSAQRLSGGNAVWGHVMDPLAGAALDGSEDWFAIDVNAGDVLTIETSTPADGALEFVNGLDPRIEIYDPSHGLVAQDDNSGGDGRNARIASLEAVQTGSYRVRVQTHSSFAGEYVLDIDGATGPGPKPSVVEVTPIDGGVISTFPSAVAITFNEQINLNSVHATDVTVDGWPSLSVNTVDGSTFEFQTNPAANHGSDTYTVRLAGGNLSDLQSRSNTEFQSTFALDATGPVILSTTWNGHPLPPSRVIDADALVFEATFNEDVIGMDSVGMDSAGLEPWMPSLDDVIITNLANNATLSPDLVEYDQGFNLLRAEFNDAIPEGDYALSLVSVGGGIRDRFDNALDGEPLGIGADGTPTGDGSVGGVYSVRFTTDVVSSDFPTPFKAKQPLGSLVYDAQTKGVIGAADDIDEFSIGMDGGQTLTVIVEPESTLRATVGIQDPQGNWMDTTEASAPGERLVLQSNPAVGDGKYIVSIGGAGASMGGYSLTVILNADVELERMGGPGNDTISTAQPLGPSFISLGAGQSDRVAVLGQLPHSTGDVLASDDFETGSLDNRWTTTSSQPEGRIQVTADQGAANGSFALLMDRESPGTSNLNEAIWTVDLSLFDAATLRFWHTEFHDEETALPLDFSGSVDGDGVAISDDGIRWRTVFVPTSLRDHWEEEEIDLAAEAAAAGMTLGDDFQIKFQQFDNLPLVDDGRGYDHVQITVPSPVDDDWYWIDLDVGETATIIAAHQSAGDFAMELFDSSGVRIAEAASSDQAHQFIRQLSGMTSDGGSNAYFIRLRGFDAEYSLTVTRQADFDFEPNNNRAPAAQDISTTGVALGYLGELAPSDRLFAIDASTDEIVELNSKTGSERNRFSLPEPASGGPDGLAFDGGSLFYSNSQGSPTLYELDPDTGAVIDFDFFSSIGLIQNIDGLGAFGGQVIALDFISNQVNFIDTELDRVVGSWTSSVDLVGGIAGAGSRVSVFASDLNEPQLVELNAATGQVINSFAAPSGDIYGVAFVDGLLYVADGGQSRVFELDPDSGEVFNSFPVAGFLSALGGDDASGTAPFSSLAVGTGADPAGKLAPLRLSSADGQDEYPDSDVYSVEVQEGDFLTVATTVPSDGPWAFANELDLALELYDPVGNLILYDASGSLIHTATRTGAYSVRVLAENGTIGEYVLEIRGNTGAVPGFQVIATDPAPGTGLLTGPQELAVEFSDSFLLTSVDAFDLMVNGGPALDVLVEDTDTLRFTLPSFVEGANHLTLAAGSLRNLQHQPLELFSTQITVDVVAPKLISSSIRDGDTADAGSLTYSATFDEALNANNLEAGDIQLVGDFSGLQIPSSFQYDPQTSTLMVEYDSLLEESFVLTLTSGDGAFEDLVGNDLDGERLVLPFPSNISGDGHPVGDFVVNFSTDIARIPFPTPLISRTPSGSLIYSREFSGVISEETDIDSFTIDVDMDQTLTVVAESTAGLQAVINLFGPTKMLVGNAVAAMVDSDTVIQTSNTTVPGPYTITVGSMFGAVGNYTLRVHLNSAVEDELHDGPSNDTLETAQDIDSSFISLGVGTAERAAVLGHASPSPTNDDWYRFTLDDSESATVVLLETLPQNVSLELFTADRTPVADAGTVSTGEHIFGSFTDDTVNGIRDTHYAKVSGIDLDYTMLIMRNATFGIASMAETPQNLTGVGTVLSHVGQIVDSTESTDFNDFPLLLSDGEGFSWDIFGNGAVGNGTIDAFDGGLVQLEFPFLDNGTLTGNGRELILGPTTSGDIELKRRIFIPADQGFIRFLEIVTNVGPTPITHNVHLLTDLGSDAGTQLIGTSTGGSSFGVEDNWLVTDDASDGDGDPTVLHVVAGPGGVRPVAASQHGEIVQATFRLPMDPGETKIVMHFASQNANRTRALAQGPQITSLGAEHLKGLTSAEIQRIVNFAIDESDWYTILVNDDEALTITTHIPAAGPGEFANRLDLNLQLFDPNGTLVATEDDGSCPICETGAAWIVSILY